MRTNHGFTLAVKNVSDEHGADGETHGVIDVANTVTPLFLVTLRAQQGFAQALVSVAEWLRQARRQGPHGLPNQIVIQYSAEREKVEEKTDYFFSTAPKSTRNVITTGIFAGIYE